MDLGLGGKLALVTGGSHGIGLRTAMALAEEGCDVAICARNKSRLKEAVSCIKEKGTNCIGISADVTKLSDIDCVLNEVIGSWGTIHILVNNAGGGGRWGNEVPEETDDVIWREVYDKNAFAAVRFTMKSLPYMLKQRWGRVITVASVCGYEAGGRPWFNMAKAAEISLMKTLAGNKRYALNNITFNSVAPGAIMIPDTGWDKMRKETPSEFYDFVDRLPLGRLGEPEEVACLVTFICSKQASLVNGNCIVADSGGGRCF
jgi:3-oxoacyl-[acyl-carrier protein] reductase